jgi:hypothetical protein
LPREWLRTLPIFGRILLGLLALGCVLSVMAVPLIVVGSPAERVITWVLSTEVLAPALIAGIALAIHLLGKANHAWRYLK